MLMPLRPGGGPTDEERVYRVLRSAVGVGGSAPDETGIDGLWRWSRARALSAGRSAFRRAIYNGSPRLATDLLPYYERALGIQGGSAAPDADRRTAVVELWPAPATVTLPQLTTALQRIDSRFSIISPDDDKSGTSLDGRWFGPLPDVTDEPEFSDNPAVGHSAYAAHTSRYVMVVLFAVGYTTALNTADARKAAAAARLLRISLPPFWDWAIVTSIGFLAGVSPVGITGVEDFYPE